MDMVLLWCHLLILYLHLGIQHAVAVTSRTVTCQAGDTVFLQPEGNIVIGPGDDVRWSFDQKLLMRNGMLQHSGEKYRVSNQSHLIICSGQNKDSGMYLVEIFDRSGVLKTKQSIRLDIPDSLQKVEQSCNEVSQFENSKCQENQQSRGYILSIVAVTFFATTFIIICLLRIKMAPLTRKEGTPDAAENVYQEMHGNLLKKNTQEEENPYVLHYDAPRRFPKRKSTKKLKQNSVIEDTYV